MDEQPRPVATTPDTDYSLSIDDALALYARAGLPRTPRTIQRYCHAVLAGRSLLGEEPSDHPSSGATGSTGSKS